MDPHDLLVYLAGLSLGAGLVVMAVLSNSVLGKVRVAMLAAAIVLLVFVWH